MNALTYWDAVTGAAAVGFCGGWLAGMFLGLWAYFSLGL